jgi:lipid-binding SYLF domain-containing protein
VRTLVACLIALTMSSPVVDASDTPEERRAELRKMAQETLTRLYQHNPGSKGAVESSAGYAVFKNFGMKILVAGTGTGRGLAVRTTTRTEIFMRMLELQAGLGVGVKKFRIVFVFETPDAFDGFIEQGWEFGAQSTAAAKTASGGKALQGAVSVSPGVWMYQLTDKGVALEVTAKGTKYLKDEDLNR